MKKPKWDETEAIEEDIPKFEDTIEVEEPSQLEAAARGAAQGVTFDFADELLAALKTSQGLSPRQEMTMPIEEVRKASQAETEAYQKELEKQRQAFKAAREAHPVTYHGSEIVSGIAPALLSGGATAASKIGKEVIEEGVKGLAKGEGLKQAAKLGAGYGAVSGAGMSEAETPAELASDIATGAGLGAGLGVAMPIAGKAAKEGLGLVKKGVQKVGEKLPSITTGLKFGAKYGLSSNQKINELMYDNTRELVDTMNKSFQKLGLQKEAAEKKAMELGKTYDVTEGIQDVADQFRKQAESLLPADAKQAEKIASEIEESFLKVDVKRQQLLEKVQKEIQNKVEKSANLQKKAIQKGEAAAVKEAEKSGASLEQLQDIKKRFEDVSELPYDTKGGRIAGQRAKFKDEYMNLEGEMVPYEYSKTYVQDTTPFQPSSIRMGETDDKLIAQYANEATGELFTKTGPKSQFLDKDFSKLTLEELSDLTSQYGQKGFDEKDPVYKELYKVVRNKLEQAGMDIPANKKEMFNLFQTMAVLGIDKTKLKYPSTEDILKLSKKVPGKMDLEKDILQRDVLKRDSELSKKLDDLQLISDAKKYLGEGYTSATGEYTKAGFIQKGISSVSDIIGAGYGKVARPANKVANKVSQMTDEGLQYVNTRLAQSENPGLQAMGRQLDEALKQEGPLKSALIWSLSQNPAFRKSVEEFLPKADEELMKELGIDIEPEFENTEPQAMMSEEVSSEPARKPAGVEERLPNIKQQEGYAGLLKEESELGSLTEESSKNKRVKGSSRHGLYYDPKGYLTAGYGHRVKSNEDPKDFMLLTEAEAEELLKKDVAQHDIDATGVLKGFGIDPESLTESQLDAVNDMVFQLGSGTASEFKNTFGLIKEGKFEEAAKEAAKSNWNKQTPERVKDFQKRIAPEAPVEDAKKAIDRQMKQQGSGNITPESHIDDTLAALENLPTDDVTINALQDEAVKMETYADAERLKQLIDTLKMS